MEETKIETLSVEGNGLKEIENQLVEVRAMMDNLLGNIQTGNRLLSRLLELKEEEMSMARRVMKNMGLSSETEDPEEIEEIDDSE